MPKKLFAMAAAAATILSIGTSTAFANTNSHIHVKRSAYMIKAPRLHSGRIVLEHPGTNLTLERGSTKYWWHVRDSRGHVGYITRSRRWTSLSGSSSHASSGSSSHSSYHSSSQLPPGVKYDSHVHHLASLHASYQTKLHAVEKVARSKLGTPYIWGHNEDRGQYGFDCSNFTAYVYHHALGYKMSGASQRQYHSVGWRVPRSQMRPGDLVIFNHGGHVGIYVGNGRMIQEGGGLGKVGYLKLRPGSYWYRHISAVKRMF